MIDIFGTLGPSCDDKSILSAMFAEGMTGIRINLSHVKLKDCLESIDRIKAAAQENGVTPKILIDMQGPEIRIGDIPRMELRERDFFYLRNGDSAGQEMDAACHEMSGIPVAQTVLDSLEVGQEVLLDDGKILAEVTEVWTEAAGVQNNQKGYELRNNTKLVVKRGGVLTSRKSLAIVGKSIDMPALTDADVENIKLAATCGVTGVMQPFVRSATDLQAVRRVLDENSGQNIQIYAKIENLQGVENLITFLPLADEIIIARGDLGNAVPLWELPALQKKISRVCRAVDKPFMVVTQMLASMEHSQVPTRAEVSDIYNAVLDGASSVMVTGETAVGEYPVEVIRYLSRTAKTAMEVND